VLKSQNDLNMTRTITTYRSNLFYMIGLNTMEYEQGKFNYSVDEQ